MSVQALGEVRLFGTDERSAAFKARDLLNAATGAAREELLAEARAVVAAVLPLDQLPDTGPSAAPRASQQLEPVQVCLLELLPGGQWPAITFATLQQAGFWAGLQEGGCGLAYGCSSLS